jgi:hypothetical protein
MGIEKGRSGRLQGKSIEKKKPSGEQSAATESASETEPPSRIIGKSLPDPPESQDRSIQITIGMKLIQRDDPEADWEVLRIKENIVILNERKRNATVSKNIDRLRQELITPGSPWRTR